MRAISIAREVRGNERREAK